MSTSFPAADFHTLTAFSHLILFILKKFYAFFLYSLLSFLSRVRKKPTRAIFFALRPFLFIFGFLRVPRLGAGDFFPGGVCDACDAFAPFSKTFPAFHPLASIPLVGSA